MRLKKEDKGTWRLLLSIVWYMIYEKGVATRRDNIDFAESLFDGIEDEYPGLGKCFGNFINGPAGRFFCNFRKFEPLAKDAIRNFDTEDGRIKEIIQMAFEVIDHPLIFDDYTSFDYNTSGLNIWEYMYFTWGEHTVLDEVYSEYVHASIDGADIRCPCRLILIDKPSDWHQIAYHNSFFQSLELFFETFKEYFA